MNEEQKTAIKSMVYAQAFVETLDRFKGTNAYRQSLKQKGNSFVQEVDKFLNVAYCGGETDSNLIDLLEECQKAVDKILEDSVTLID
jgi:hypothetical protein